MMISYSKSFGTYESDVDNEDTNDPYKGTNDKPAHENPKLPTEKPNARAVLEGKDHLEFGSLVVAAFPEMLRKSDDYAVELTRPYRDVIMRPSLFNWKVNQGL